MTQGFVHSAEDDLVFVDISANPEGWLVLRFVHITTPLGNVTQRPEWVSQGAEQGNNLVYPQDSQSVRTLAAALRRTGTACEFEVPLGVGNSLGLEVT